MQARRVVNYVLGSPHRDRDASLRTAPDDKLGTPLFRMDTANHLSHSTNKVLYAALLANSAIVIAKMIAAAVTGSSAMLSECIHSLVDMGNGGLLLLGLSLSRRPLMSSTPLGMVENCISGPWLYP